MFHQILFLIFGAVCVAGAINLLVQRHPINSALSLVVVMGSLALIYLLLGAEFVAAVQVIVYAGAIMVLFVFTIMLLNAGVEERTRGSRIALGLGGPGVVLLIGMISWIIFTNDKQMGGVQIGSMVTQTDNTHSIAKLLFRDFLLPFEVTSVLILIAIMGAVVLAGRRR
jgi:NADH-quinone oxidoreductase subunit J